MSLKCLFCANLVPKLHCWKCFVQNKNPYKEYSEMLILNSTIVFRSSTLNYLVWENLVPELQSALFEMNLGTKRYSRVLIPIHPKGCWNQHLWVPLCTYFHSKQTTVKIQDQICPKKVGILGTKFKKIIVDQQSWIPLHIKFHFKQNLMKTWPKLPPKKYFGTKFRKMKSPSTLFWVIVKQFTMF